MSYPPLPPPADGEKVYTGHGNYDEITYYTAEQMRAYADAALAEQPIDMVLFCPKCHLQHIDAAEPVQWAPPWASDITAVGAAMVGELNPDRWTNPPHRSHLCHGCGNIWRPADVPTNGVAAIKTQGKHDSP